MLPATLLALLFASPSLANLTTPNDPLRSIAVHASPKPEPLPICCLKPLDAPEDDVMLLSFEEWKAKQQNLREQAIADSDPGNRSGQGTAGGGGEGFVAANLNGSEPGEAPTDPPQKPPEPGVVTTEELSPHFRVPITDRFNYASTVCSARVHASHRTAKSASSILASKRDKYMLSPCAEKQQFVIVELCEDIRIDTVQLANFEFFSGVFKEFSVSVAKTYTTDGEGWVDAGRFVAKNIRGVQSFHPPTSLRDFYRYLRIDFHSHYGNEYYCPVSLLRVYGLTHLEEWKWEVWQAESKAKKLGNSDSAPAAAVSQTLEAVVVQPPKEVLNDNAIPSAMNNNSASTTSPSSQASSTKTASLSINSGAANSSVAPEERRQDDAPNSHDSQMISPDDMSTRTRGAKASAISSLKLRVRASRQSLRSPPPDVISLPSGSHTTAIPVSNPVDVNPNGQNVVSDSPGSSVPGPSVPSQVSSPTAQTAHDTSQTPVTPMQPTTSSSSSSASPSQHHPNIINVNSGGGESIYRTIMNRLTALEVNHTLYARYVEEQIGGIREVLRRLTEDVGRLEGIGKGQAQMYYRAMREWEANRDRSDLRYEELLNRVNYLADEVILEKRLGIAQLCLLIAVLVFMSLTRGSRVGEIGLQPMVSRSAAGVGSAREWRRQLNVSGEWISNRLGRNRSRRRSLGEKSSNRPSAPAHEDAPHIAEDDSAEPDFQLAFPSKGGFGAERIAHLREDTRSRSRTPSLRRVPSSRFPPHLHHWGTPATTRSGAVPALVYRANSLGDRRQVAAAIAVARSGLRSGGDAPEKSVKRWARSAHLHAVPRGGAPSQPRSATRSGAVSAKGDLDGRRLSDSEDVFASPQPDEGRQFALKSVFKPENGLESPSASFKSSEQQPGCLSAEESDLWVDTDTAESCNGDGDGDLELDAQRPFVMRDV